MPTGDSIYALSQQMMHALASSPEPTPMGVPALAVYPAHPSALSKEHLQASYGDGKPLVKDFPGLAQLVRYNTPVRCTNKMVTATNAGKGSVTAECEAYVALATLVQMFQGNMQPQTLLAQVETVLRLCCAAGWQDRVIKKHHWLLRFPARLEEHGVTASCFTAERKHKDVSRRAVGMYNAKCLKEGSG